MAHADDDALFLSYTRDHEYITLKIYVNSARTHHELPIYKHLDAIQSDHAGRRCLHLLHDSFKVDGPDGQHICLLHQPLGRSLHEMKRRARGRISKDVLRPCMRQVFAAVDYLHKDARVIHTGEFVSRGSCLIYFVCFRSG